MDEDRPLTNLSLPELAKCLRCISENIDQRYTECDKHEGTSCEGCPLNVNVDTALARYEEFADKALSRAAAAIQSLLCRIDLSAMDRNLFMAIEAGIRGIGDHLATKNTSCCEVTVGSTSVLVDYSKAWKDLAHISAYYTNYGRLCIPPLTKEDGLAMLAAAKAIGESEKLVMELGVFSFRRNLGKGMEELNIPMKEAHGLLWKVGFSVVNDSSTLLTEKEEGEDTDGE